MIGKKKTLGPVVVGRFMDKVFFGECYGSSGWLVRLRVIWLGGEAMGPLVGWEGYDDESSGYLGRLWVEGLLGILWVIWLVEKAPPDPVVGWEGYGSSGWLGGLWVLCLV